MCVSKTEMKRLAEHIARPFFYPDDDAHVSSLKVFLQEIFDRSITVGYFQKEGEGGRLKQIRFFS